MILLLDYKYLWFSIRPGFILDQLVQKIHSNKFAPGGIELGSLAP